MYLYQRLFGVFVFIVSLLIIYFMINKCKNYKSVKYILIAYIIILSLMSYLFRPVTPVDLVRLQNQLTNTFSKMSFSDIVYNLKSGSITNFTTYIYFFIISKIGNLNLLQTFATMIFYSILFYIIYDYSKTKEVSTSIIAKTIFYIMINGQFVELISGIRTLLGFSIMLLALYREFFKDKSILSNIILYILAIGFHNAILPIIIIRIVYLGLQKERKPLIKIFNIILLFVLIIVFCKYGSVFIESSVGRANLYLNNQIYVQKWEYLASFFRIGLMLFLLLVGYRICKNDILIKNYLRLGIYYLIFNSIFYSEYTMFHRYSIYISAFMIPIVIELFNKTQLQQTVNSKRSITLYRLIYLAFLLMIAGISFTRGNMTELTFFN